MTRRSISYSYSTGKKRSVRKYETLIRNLSANMRSILSTSFIGAAAHLDKWHLRWPRLLSKKAMAFRTFAPTTKHGSKGFFYLWGASRVSEKKASKYCLWIWTRNRREFHLSSLVRFPNTHRPFEQRQIVQWEISFELFETTKNVSKV